MLQPDPLSTCPKILVIGDIMLDVWLYGTIDRMAPEAAAPVVNAHRERKSLGGAANVANQITALGAQCVLAGYIGDDAYGADLIAMTAHIDTSPVVTVFGRPTVSKYRIIGNHGYVVRVDREETTDIHRGAMASIVSYARSTRDLDAIVFSDYCKGTTTRSLVLRIMQIANERNIPVLVDTKRADWSAYAGAHCIVPNEKELSAVLGIDVCGLDSNEIYASVYPLLQDFERILLTRAERGMTLFTADSACDVPAIAVPNVDPTGSGDAVVASLAVSLASGHKVSQAMSFANAAGAWTAARHGTPPLVKTDIGLLADRPVYSNKVVQLSDLISRVAQWKSAGKRIVFTNGCFDLLHADHIHLLESAKMYGDILIVGLNTDHSVQANKGPDRPIITEQQRAYAVSSLSCVDVIVWLSEDTPASLIAHIRPDVLVKGHDHRGRKIVGEDDVTTHGGQVITLASCRFGITTTSVTQRIGSLS